MTEMRCETCGKFMRKATKDDENGLTWLWPDEKWICPSCLTRISISSMEISY